MKYFIALTALLFASSSAFCASKTAAPKCNYEGSTQESNACVYDELNAADRELNKTYQVKLASLPKAEKSVLREEQRGWLKTRDSQCKEDTQDMEGTTGWVSEFYGCVAAATKERTLQLKNWKRQ